LRKGDPQALHCACDLATASGSGLDRQISPAAAEYQVRRVWQKLIEEFVIRALVAANIEDRQLGVLSCGSMFW
jgi:K+-transporting ATPase ATPase C chain